MPQPVIENARGDSFVLESRSDILQSKSEFHIVDEPAAQEETHIGNPIEQVEGDINGTPDEDDIAVEFKLPATIGSDVVPKGFKVEEVNSNDQANRISSNEVKIEFENVNTRVKK